jgi:hypothetical protein
MASPLKGLRVVDNPTVREDYANKLVSTMFDGGAVTITMGIARFLPEKTEGTPKQGDHPKVHVAARLVLSPAAAVELANALANMLNTLNQVASSRPDQKPN